MWFQLSKFYQIGTIGYWWCRTLLNLDIDLLLIFVSYSLLIFLPVQYKIVEMILYNFVQ